MARSASADVPPVEGFLIACFVDQFVIQGSAPAIDSPVSGHSWDHVVLTRCCVPGEAF